MIINGKNILFSIIHDITDKKRNESELILAREEADKANLAKSHFLSTMSHEIRTPLNGVMGMIDILKYTDLDNRQKKIIQNIDKASGNLMYIVNEVLEYSKLEDGKQEAEKEQYKLRESFEKLYSIFEVSLKENVDMCFFV